jgi:diphthine synthase
MVLFIIGLGLGDERDISIKGFDAIKSSDIIYLENYTSILGVDKNKIEKFYQREVIVADREFCEGEIDLILEDIAKNPNKNFSFLVVGDPFCATTHTDLYLRAIKLNIKVNVIHNASIINAIGINSSIIQ